VIDPSPPIDPILPLENETRLVDPTLLLDNKPDTSHVFLVDKDSTVPRGIPPSLVEPPPSNEAIRFDWGVLTGPCLPSHIPF
jgi:hypothetical protein